MDYALIEDGIVVNTIYLHPMNADEFPNAAAMNGLPIAIGDTYVDGKFYRNGVEVTLPTTISEEEVQCIKDEAITEVQNELNS